MSEPTQTQALQPLSLSPKAELVVKPKPTKSEILDALTELRIESIRKENAIKQERKIKLQGQLRTQFVRHAKDNALKLNPTINFGYKSGGTPTQMEVEFKLYFNDLAPDTQKLLNEYHDIQLVSYGGSTCDAKKRIRKELSDALENKQSTADRVQAMLNNKESRASLETILDNLTGKAVNIPAANAKA